MLRSLDVILHMKQHLERLQAKVSCSESCVSLPGEVTVPKRVGRTGEGQDWNS